MKGGISSIRPPNHENVAKCNENARKIRRHRQQGGNGIGMQRLQKQQKDKGIAKHRHHKKQQFRGTDDLRRPKQHKASESRKYNKMHRKSKENEAA